MKPQSPTKSMIYRTKTQIHTLLYWAAVITQGFWSRNPRPLRIGITGSAGKSTAKILLGAILSAQDRTRVTDDNGFRKLSRRALIVGPWYRYWVQEIATSRRGEIASGVRIVRPRIGVVTTIGDDHYTSFRSREAIAKEKATLVSSLPPEGVAVLNADDPLVLAMASLTKARVLTYGQSPDVDVRLRASSGAWPDGLTVEIEYRGQKQVMHANLYGRHWVTSILAATASALAVGISLEDCAAAISRAQPVEGRLSAHATPGGVTFLRDDWKAPLWTLSASLEALRSARARRKIAVIGTLSDYAGSSSPKYRQAAQAALKSADRVIFVGKFAANAVKGAPDDDRLRGFRTQYEANNYLNEILVPGDLVLIKGSVTADHLQRLALAQTGDIACWRTQCGRFYACTDCKLRMDPYQPGIE